MMTGNGHAKQRRRALSVGVTILVAIGLVVVAASAALSLGLDLGLTARDIEATISAWGPWGVTLSIGLMVAHSFVPFPAEFLAIANGMLYGPVWGTAITWTGAMLGAFLAFALARWLGRSFVQVVVAQRHWEALDEWTAHQGGYVVLISRFIPVIAFNLINYAAGLTRISWWTFTWTTGVGIMPLTVLMVVMGDNIHTLAWESWILLLAGSVILWFVLRRKLALPRTDKGAATSRDARS